MLLPCRCGSATVTWALDDNLCGLTASVVLRSPAAAAAPPGVHRTLAGYKDFQYIKFGGLINF